MDPPPPPPSPRPPALDAELASPSPGALCPEATLEHVVIGDEDLSALHAPRLALRGVRLRGTVLAGAELDGLELSDVELSGCDLANARIGPHVGWRRVRARHCRLTGAALGDGVLRDVTIEDSRVDLASFQASRLERVTFADCMLTQTDFLEAELDAVRFTRCDLTQLDLRGARLRRCELRGCRLDGLRGIERLRGAAMPWPDIVGAAGIWAASLGIEVIDDG